MPGPFTTLKNLHLGKGEKLHYDPTVIDGVTLAVVDTASTYGRPAGPITPGKQIANYVRGGLPGVARSNFTLDKSGLYFVGAQGGARYTLELPDEFKVNSNSFMLTFWTKMFAGNGDAGGAGFFPMVRIGKDSVVQANFGIVIETSANSLFKEGGPNWPGLSLGLGALGYQTVFDNLIHQHAYHYEVSPDQTKARGSFYLDGTLRVQGQYFDRVPFTPLASTDKAIFGSRASDPGGIVGMLYRARIDQLSGSGLKAADIVRRDYEANVNRITNYNV